MVSTRENELTPLQLVTINATKTLQAVTAALHKLT